MDQLQYLVEYGSIVAGIIILVGLAGFYWAGRGQKYHLPKGALRWSVAALSTLLIFAGSATIYTVENTLGPLKSAYQQENNSAAHITYRNLADDSKREVSDLKGKVVIVNFWATWCGPCREEMPALSQLYDSYKSQGLVVLTISDEDPSAIKEYFAERDLHFLKGYLPDKSSLDPGMQELLQIRPVSFIIDRSGRIMKSIPGKRDMNYWQSQVRRYL